MRHDPALRREKIHYESSVENVKVDTAAVFLMIRILFFIITRDVWIGKERMDEKEPYKTVLFILSDCRVSAPKHVIFEKRRSFFVVSFTGKFGIYPCKHLRNYTVGVFKVQFLIGER